MFKRKDTESSFRLYKENSNIDYFALRSTPSGHIVVQNSKTNNLSIYDKKLVLVGELESSYEDAEDTFHAYKNPHFSNEGGKMIWFGDKYGIVVIDLKDMSRELLDTGFAQDNDTPAPEPTYCIADFEKGKYLVYCSSGTQNYFSSIELIDEKENFVQDYRIKIHEQRDILPNYILGQKISFLDVSSDKSISFVGGISSSTKHAIITVFKFD